MERVRLDVLAISAALAAVLMLVTERLAGRSTAADVIQFCALVLFVNLVVPRLRGLPKRKRVMYILLFCVAFGVATALLRLAIMHLL